MKAIIGWTDARWDGDDGVGHDGETTVMARMSSICDLYDKR